MRRRNNQFHTKGMLAQDSNNQICIRKTELSLIYAIGIRQKNPSLNTECNLLEMATVINLKYKQMKQYIAPLRQLQNGLQNLAASTSNRGQIGCSIE